MGSRESNQEVEIKLRMKDAAQGRALMEAAGCRESHPRTLERNILFDTAEAALRSSSQLLRLREYGDQRLVTYKGKSIAGPHKVREEIELEISDAERLGLILGRLGYLPGFRYEKYRTEFTDIHGAGLALLDETPIGVYVELEGDPDWIDRTAAAMGFSPQDYILSSYGTLYTEYCEQHGAIPGNMVFDEQAC